MTNQEAVKARRKETRRRLRDDFEYYAPRSLKLRPKDPTKGLLKFTFNKAQRILHEALEKQLRETGHVRAVILKGRQMGQSTYVGGRQYWKVSQSKAVKAMVITHKADSTKTLFDMTKRFHDNCPEALRPHTKYSSRTELMFDKLDSSYTVATAGGDGIGRGETITHLHASEVGFWPKSIARENWNGVTKCVPNAPGTSIIVESTANGVGDLFHELWLGAVAGTNGFIAIFVPWFIQDEYAIEPPAPLDHTPEELELIKQHGLNDAQLYWRRLEIGATSLELFKQEYPCTPEEAFLTSGRPVFNPVQLKTLSDKAPLTKQRLALVVDDGANKWEENVLGELFVFRTRLDGVVKEDGTLPADGELPAEPERYSIGADVGGGVKGDPSVAQVLDSKNRQVAVWRGTILPDFYGRTLAALGEYYNWAHLGVELNNHGILTLHVLSKEVHYPHLYQDTVYDTVNETETQRLGFTTSVKSKPLVIDKLRGTVRDAKIEINDKVTIGEMQTFIVAPSGKMQGQEGCHDDHVMSLAIANHVNEQGVGYVATSDEQYAEAI